MENFAGNLVHPDQDYMEIWSARGIMVQCSLSNCQLSSQKQRPQKESETQAPEQDAH